MDIYFAKETIAALVKAGVKSEVFLQSEDSWRGRDIDSRHIVAADYPIIKKVVQSAKQWDLIENRRVLRKLEAVELLRSDEKKRIGRVELIPDALREALAKTPHKWLFVGSSYGPLLPWLVTGAYYHPPQRHHDSYTAAHTDIKCEAIERGHERSRTITVYREGLCGSIDEILAKEDACLENPKLVEEYAADLARYTKFAPQTGEQFLARGAGVAAGEGGWRHGERLSFGREDEAAKAVMDDQEEQGKDTGITATSWWSKGAKGDDDEEDEKNFKLPVHPVVRVFDLGTHEYVDAHISMLEAYPYDASAGEKLVLPAEHKELIDALTSSAVERMEDIVRGKARGVIILCSGKPGTGKTLTAEVYSEVARRPLYIVQCSQLGTDEGELEKRLIEVLGRATRWRAILLIDEADVYIYERGESIRQNAIVGVFLRLLEYYNGILFMNTNRVTVVDDAILSRVTAHVKYAIPEGAMRERLWRVLAKQYAVAVTDEHGNGDLNLHAAIEAFPKVSGRTIRQLLKLGRIIEGGRVTVDTLKLAAKFHDFTELDDGQA